MAAAAAAGARLARRARRAVATQGLNGQGTIAGDRGGRAAVGERPCTSPVSQTYSPCVKCVIALLALTIEVSRGAPGSQNPRRYTHGNRGMGHTRHNRIGVHRIRFTGNTRRSGLGVMCFGTLSRPEVRLWTLTKAQRRRLTTLSRRSVLDTVRVFDESSGPLDMQSACVCPEAFQKIGLDRLHHVSPATR